MSKELDDAYFRSTPCTHHEPLLSKLVDCVDLLEERIKGLLGAKVYVGETNTLPAGSEATASASKRGYDTVLGFGIPKGEKGDPGDKGAPGAPGEPGADGYSPTASVTKNGGTATITVTDKNGTTTATVSDGAPGKDGSDATATDVRINGTNITVDGVADIPIASWTIPGVVKVDNYYGGYSSGLFSSEGRLFLNTADNESITDRSLRHNIDASNIDYAVKAAMTDGKGAAWTVAEQTAAKKRMGIEESGGTSPNTPYIWVYNYDLTPDIGEGIYTFPTVNLKPIYPDVYGADVPQYGDIIFYKGFIYYEVVDSDSSSTTCRSRERIGVG